MSIAPSLWVVGAPVESRRVIAPAPVNGRNGRASGLSAEDLSWILTNAPTETLVLKPSPVATEHAVELAGPVR